MGLKNHSFYLEISIQSWAMMRDEEERICAKLVVVVSKYLCLMMPWIIWVLRVPNTLGGGLVFINDSIKCFVMIVGKWTFLTLRFVIYTNQNWIVDWFWCRHTILRKGEGRDLFVSLLSGLNIWSLGMWWLIHGRLTVIYLRIWGILLNWCKNRIPPCMVTFLFIN